MIAIIKIKSRPRPIPNKLAKNVVESGNMEMKIVIAHTKIQKPSIPAELLPLLKRIIEIINPKTPIITPIG